MTASGFRVRVTGLVFVFKSVSLALKQVPTCIWKPETFDKSVNFILVVFGRFIQFQVVLDRFSSFLTLVSIPKYDVTKIRLPRTKCQYNIFHKLRTGSSKIHKFLESVSNLCLLYVAKSQLHSLSRFGEIQKKYVRGVTFDRELRHPQSHILKIVFFKQSAHQLLRFLTQFQGYLGYVQK